MKTSKQLWLAISITILMLLSNATSSECALADEPRPPGSRVELTCGQLFIPEGFAAPDGKVDLVVHLHGSAVAAEKNLQRSNSKAVLVSVMLKGLSAVYAKQFSEPQVWNGILKETREQLSLQKVVDQAEFRRVTVVSFSAGFGGVRELLKDDAIFARIDALVMADSIYAGYVADTKPPQVDPKAMTGFLKFAREAAAGRKSFVISHCDLKPEGYASTAETADYLLNELRLKREPAEVEWESGWKRRTRCGIKGFQVHGFAGETGADHMKHLHGAWRLIQLSIP